VVAVDTNVLVFAADADSRLHAGSLAWVERQRTRPDAWFMAEACDFHRFPFLEVVEIV
jgi:predicted nucleic acid-binding protein